MTSPPRILIVEDEELIRLSLRERLEEEGHQVAEAGSVAEGWAQFRRFEPDLALLDLKLPDGNGLQLLKRIMDEVPRTVCLMMTAHGTVETAVEALTAGAQTYLTKPLDLEDVVAHVAKGLETTALRREVESLRKEQAAQTSGLVVVSESPAMKDVLETIRKVNEADAPTLLLLGESGVGKDLVAKAIRSTSHRAKQPFQNITCTAIPDNLLESELFGHEKGAFTDAKQRKQGLFELANGGTVFLDEIGDMSVPLQAKMLRFLEDRTFRRVGGTQDIRVDVRVIAATNRDLEEAVRQEQFRQDLYYRISVIPISIPPLRSRREDIGPLADLFAERYAREFKRPARPISTEAKAALENHDWPGNVRELRNVVERAMILGEGSEIRIPDLPREIQTEEGACGRRNNGSYELPEAGIIFEELEKDLVIQALARTRQNQTRAARLLGMTRDQIRYRIEKFKLVLGLPTAQ